MIYKLRIEADRITLSEEDLVSILEMTKKIAVTQKALKQIVESELLSFISYLPHRLWEGKVKPKEINFEREKEKKIANSLISFAKEIYEIKIDRDAFSGKRRSYALNLLGNVSCYFDTSCLMELCSRSMKSRSKCEFVSSVEVMKDYCILNNCNLDNKLLLLVNKRIKNTKRRIEAVCGLNFLIEIGVISEFEALSRIDEWKEKNCTR